jgi:hypothetical protein
MGQLAGVMDISFKKVTGDSMVEFAIDLLQLGVSLPRRISMEPFSMRELVDRAGPSAGPPGNGHHR